MYIIERRFKAPIHAGNEGLIEHFANAAQFRLPKGEIPLRFLVSGTDSDSYQCEVGAIESAEFPMCEELASAFEFRRRATENVSTFNAVFLIPTGIGVEIGGHAGDATPAARMLAQSCDHLILHPNVVNASDINEAPENSIYLEGSVITRLLMGTIAIEPVRSNRVLVIVDGDHHEVFFNAAVNSVNAAISSYGFRCVEIVKMQSPVKLKTYFTDSGRASGIVDNFEPLFSELEKRQGNYDAVAIASLIHVPDGIFEEYFRSDGDKINPWGGVEALLTHAITQVFNVPSAHSPMMESPEIANLDVGIVDPRMAAEAVSMTFLNCILKGLQKSPRIITDEHLFYRPGVMTASDVSCLIIPDGCLGLPTLAALEQGIPVIAVRENRNLMRNDLALLPWQDGQFHRVETYLEAAGIINALKAGVAPESLRRPLNSVKIADSSSEQPMTCGDGKAIQLST